MTGQAVVLASRYTMDPNLRTGIRTKEQVVVATKIFIARTLVFVFQSLRAV